MGSLKDFRSLISKRLSIYTSNVSNTYRIRTKSLEKVFKEAKNYFDMPIEDIRFEIESIESVGLLRDTEYNIVAYPKAQQDFEDIDKEFEKNINGAFFIRRGKGLLYLMVSHPEEGGLSVSYEDVMKELATFTDLFASIDQDTVRKVIKEEHSSWEKIANFDYIEEHNAEIDIRTGNNDMVASIMLQHPEVGGADLTSGGIHSFLTSEGIIHGVQEEIIEWLERKPIYNQWIEIAVGNPSQDGEDAHIILLSHIDAKNESQSKKAYYKKNEQDVFKKVYKNNIVAEKIPLTEGKEGVDVFSNLIFPKPGADIEMRGNENVVITDDNSAVMALEDGSVYLKKNTVCVDKVWEIDGDVTTEIGDIDFPGTVVIRGGVPIGVTIKVEGNLIILGSVNNAHLIVGGDLHIANGMLGRGEGKIEVEGSLVVRFLEHASIKVGNVCLVEDSIINCHIICYNQVIAVEGRGHITSSEIISQKKIVAKTIGATLGSTTELKIFTLLEDRLKLDTFLEKREELKNYIASQRSFFGEDFTPIGIESMTEEQKAEIAEKLEILKKKQIELKKMNTLTHYLKSKIDKYATKAKIVVLRKIHAGSSITFDEKTKVIRNDMTTGVFSKKNNVIVSRSYQDDKDGVPHKYIESIVKNVKL